MTTQPSKTNKWYTTILVLTIMIPIAYILYLFLMVQNGNQTIEELMNTQPIYVVLLLVSFINPIWGHFLNQIPKEERVKKGRGDRFLSLMLISQIVVGNLIMAFLVFITKRNLPQSSNTQPLTAFEKTVASILLVLSLFSGFVLLKLTL
ncbi:hypothetical protein [Robertmurraya kyonggiensis]|uniref:Uncharacterized protein n=1 Tax=Robertmurraya kyonggiensis TaxID=1037680 RepID=A0A4U1D2X8_9BACI|nr:hypothetical protein [Robertmurraya kyonggiensis]TKC16745.1 hypothetical protein FA727_11785 [Robertmurraya kyonggiensis]